MVSVNNSVDIPQLSIINASEKRTHITVIATIFLIVLNVLGYYMWNVVKSAYIQLKEEENQPDSSSDLHELRDQGAVNAGQSQCWTTMNSFQDTMDLCPTNPSPPFNSKNVTFSPYHGDVISCSYY